MGVNKLVYMEIIPVAQSTTTLPGKKHIHEQRSRTAQESSRIPEPQVVKQLQSSKFQQRLSQTATHQSEVSYGALRLCGLNVFYSYS